MKNIVYITTNLLNGKQYVGSHKVLNHKKDRYLGSGILISQSVKKYGKENFKREILEKCQTIKEARLLEKYYIEKYNSIIPNGYNISPNGGIMLFEGHTSESKIKISKSIKGKSYEEIYGMDADLMKEKRKKERIGMKFSKEWKKNLSESHKGYKQSKEQKRKIGEFQKNKQVSIETGIKISQSKKGLKAIHNKNSGKNKFIRISELDNYLSNNWEFGFLKKQKITLKLRNLKI